MNRYKEYLNEIKTRKTQGLNPKPIDNIDLIFEIIQQIKDKIAKDFQPDASK